MKKIFYVLFLLLFLITIASSEDAHKGADVVVLSKSTASWDNSVLPAYPTGDPEISILKITIPVGVTLPLHKHPVINAGYMLRGKLTVVSDDGKVLHLKAGDSIVELVNKFHYGKNEGLEPVEIIVFYAGEKGKEITVKK